MNPDNLYQSSVQIFEGLLTPAGNNALSAALTAVATPLTALMVIYVIVTGILCSLGEFSARLAVSRILRAGFVSMLLTATYFNPYVRDLFITTLPNWIVSSVSSGSSGSVPQQCDQLRSALLHASAAIYQQASWTDWDIKVELAVIGGLATMFLAVLVLVYEAVKTFTLVTVCAAPFVIGAYLFDATKGFVEGWIGKMVGLTALQLLVSVVVQVIVDANMAMMRQAGGSLGSGMLNQVSALMGITVFFGMMAVLVIGLPSIAYSIGRGVSFNTGALSALTAPSRILHANPFLRAGKAGGGAPSKPRGGESA